MIKLKITVKTNTSLDPLLKHQNKEILPNNNKIKIFHLKHRKMTEKIKKKLLLK